MGSKKLKKKLKNKNSKKLKKNRILTLNGHDFKSCIDSINSLHTFSEIRENYFKYLQKVIKENLNNANNNILSHEFLQKISLIIEQQALLACMQSDIYQKTMIEIIQDIKKSSEKMQLHIDIKNFLLSHNLDVNGTSSRLTSHGENIEKESSDVYSHIPIFSTERSTYNDCEGIWESQNVLENNYYNSMNNCNNINNCIVKNELSASYEDQNVKDNESEQLNYDCENSNDHNDSNIIFLSLVPQNSVPLEKSSEETIKETEIQKLDPISQAKAQLQKSVEQSLKKLEEIKLQNKEMRDRAMIAKILEDDDNDVQYDSLSDNCDEIVDQKSEEKHDSLLTDRLDEMRQLFGMDMEEEKISKNCSYNTDKYIKKKKIVKQNIWYHERVIQMYKLSMLASVLTDQEREINKHLFLQCFGEDSDEENEAKFMQEDKYMASCKERISSWVVKYLMPFYNNRQIIGKNVFKCLGQHVSSAIIEQMQYPCEWTVKYFVRKFFPPNKRFANESDVTYFQIY